MSAQTTHPTETVYVGDDWVLPRTVPPPFLPLTGKTFEWVMVNRGALDVVIPSGAASIQVIDEMAGDVEVRVPAGITVDVAGNTRYDDALRLTWGTDGTRTTVVTGQIHAKDYGFDATGDGALVGPPGPPGPQGPPGPPGPSPLVADYSFNDTTTAPPSSGQVRLNNADQTLATMIWISNITSPGNDISAFFSTAVADDELYLQDKDDATKWQLYKIGSLVTAAAGYIEYPIIWLQGGVALTAQRVLIALTKK